MTSAQVYYVGKKPYLKIYVKGQSVCLCLRGPPVSHFIYTSQCPDLSLPHVSLFRKKKTCL